MFTTLANLTGTDKQITWATGIRRKQMGKFDECMQQNMGAAIEQGEQVVSAARPLWLASREWLTAQGDSRFWIDNREISGFEMARLALKGAKSTQNAGGAK